MRADREVLLRVSSRQSEYRSVPVDAADPARQENLMTRPFEGVRVVDLSDRLSGAFAARLFGDYGADVMLAEPSAGHPLRHEPPFLDDQPGDDRSVLHAYANWNKRSIVLDRDAALVELVAGADVVVTTASPIGEPLAEALRGLSADAVHLSVTPHGLDGPLAERPGNNLTASARTGWAYVNAYHEEPPLQMPGRQSGYIGGVAGFIAAAAALRRRDDTAGCERVDVSEIEAFALTVHPWGIGAIYQDIGWSRGPAGGKTRGEPGPLWQTADGQINFGLGDWHNWPEAMRLLKLPELAEREDLIPDLGRHSTDMSAVIAGAAREVALMERWPLFHALADLRCISGVLQDIEDIVRDPQLAARDFITETTVEGRPIRTAGAPAKVEPSPWEIRRPAPQLGADGGATSDRPTRVATPHRESGPPSPEGPLSGIRPPAPSSVDPYPSYTTVAVSSTGVILSSSGIG